MKSDTLLMIPGPTPVPQAILEVLARPPIGHRSEGFKKILNDVYTGLQWVFQTKQPVLLYTASGTGAMEAALVNVLNAGDTVLVLDCGVFSHRWAEIAKTLGLTVQLLSVPPGEPNLPETLAQTLNGPEGKNIKAVCLIHSETSTGVMNPIQELTRVVREHSEALVIVDTVTSLGATEFKFDDWGVDIAVSGSQKGFMLPPGLAFLAVSERAMAAHKQCATPGYYFNFSKYEKSQSTLQTPYTPAITLTCGLQKALSLLQEEGLEGVFARHALNRKMARESMLALGLPLLVKDDQYASPATTAVYPGEGASVDAVRAAMRERFSITIANGQKDLAGKIFRIGHLGAIFPRDMLTVISCLETVYHQHGFTQAQPGVATGKAQEVLNRHGR